MGDSGSDRWHHYVFGRLSDVFLPGELRMKPELTRTLGHESSGKDVEQVQKWLLLEPTGYFSKKTEKAVIKFQKAWDLTVDGLVGPETWGKMLDVFYEEPTPPQPDDPGPEPDPTPKPPQKGTRSGLGLVVAIGVALVAIMLWAL